MKSKSLIGGTIGTILSSMGMAISAEQLDHILSIICSVLGAIIVLITSIIIPLVQWYKKAKADGKITKEELEEGKKIISNGVEKTKESIDDAKNKK